ncbi:MAG: hypothetical protein LBB76_00325 [Azoarcus sp.]|nr:hypothetical protein [Azoarcus sp.]
MARAWRHGRVLLLAVVSVSYLCAIHFTVVAGQPSSVGALLAVLPLALAAFAMAWTSRSRGLALLLWSAAFLALVGLWPVLESRFEWVYFLQHAGVFSLLALGFGRSLAPGAEPLVSRFARVSHGALAPEVARYTRRVTVAWALFFAGLVLVSVLFFINGQTGLWSLFINFITPVSIGLMFVVEFAVRSVVLPRALRTGFAESIRAFLHIRRNVG